MILSLSIAGARMPGTELVPLPQNAAHACAFPLTALRAANTHTLNVPNLRNSRTHNLYDVKSPCALSAR